MDRFLNPVNINFVENRCPLNKCIQTWVKSHYNTKRLNFYWGKKSFMDSVICPIPQVLLHMVCSRINAAIEKYIGRMQNLEYMTHTIYTRINIFKNAVMLQQNSTLDF